MSELLKERKDMDPSYQWDLTTLFKSDEAWKESLKEAENKMPELTSYEGRLNNAETISAFLKDQTAYERKLNDIYCYAELRAAEDMRDAAGQSMQASAMSLLVKYQAAVSYARPEILSLDQDTLDAIVNDPVLKDYQFTLKDLLREKAHTLSKKEENIIAQFGEVLHNPEETAEALMDADLVFDEAEDSDGNKHEVTSSSYITLQNSNDRTLRKNSFDSLYKTYSQHIHTFTKTYAGCVKGSVTEARLRGYDSSRQMSMASDNIPESVYDNLIDTIHNRMDVMYRYVKLRKRLLGVDELHYYDLYAPLTKGSAAHYTYEQAKQMVVDAVTPLGEDYVNRVKDAYKDGWIDVYPNKGKMSGAFSSGTYDSNPFIMLNFTGSLESVSTLAHEMGHSQHTWLTNHHQPAQYSNYSLFVAEVASTVNENLLIEQLLKKETNPSERLALLNQYLEGFKGTVYRQTMFAEFEKEAHAMVERGETLTSDALNDLYARLIKLYFGEDLVFDDAVKYEWARIPHFYYTFYVYVYATGYSSASAISQAILKEGKPAVKRYLEFLSMGSSAYPLEELKHAGVDLTTPEPINTALDKFASVLDDAEKTADILGL